MVIVFPKIGNKILAKKHLTHKISTSPFSSLHLLDQIAELNIQLNQLK